MLTHLIELLSTHASFKGPSILKAEGPVIFVVPATIIMIYGAVASIVWLHRDALNRNKNGLVAVLFILLTGWPASFIWWFWLRPPLSLRSTGQDQTTA